jgi:cytochrome c oxidase subunit III
MTVIVVFLLVIVGISGWWLAQHRLMSKPWLEQGLPEGLPGATPSTLPTAKVGLGVFLAVVGALFALFASAYFMRMELADWQAPPVPMLLWFNTGVLVLASVALHFAVVAARRGEDDVVRLALVTAGVTTFVFLAGQLMVWRQLVADGYYLNTNAANGFFYLLTGMHGLHILGGLIGLARTTARSWSARDTREVRLSVDLCAMYWHFLLFIWIALVALLAGWASEFIEICRQLLS